MSDETMRHMFDKFYQGDTSHSMAGNGLGLTLVKKIVELCEGTIEVQSELGQGSVFAIRLPLSAEK
ncbi:Alkaline phosphatase synthesis sensor protein PhoR [compost metagenome]